MLNEAWFGEPAVLRPVKALLKNAFSVGAGTASSA
jgi:hypothetical protein